MNAPLLRFCAAFGAASLLLISNSDRQPLPRPSPHAATNHFSALESLAPVEERNRATGGDRAAHTISTGFSEAGERTETPAIAGSPPVAAAGGSRSPDPDFESSSDFTGPENAAPSRKGGDLSVLTSKPAATPTGAGGNVTQAELDALENGLNQALTAIEASLVADILTETFPLVGDRFAAAYDNNVAGFRYLTTLRNAVVAGLASLPNANYTSTQVATAINTRLNSAGFNSGSAVTVSTLNDQVQIAFVTLDTFNPAAVPIASDFGLPNLDLDLRSPANASTTINVTLRFTAGVDGDGFYVETSAPNTLFTINTTTTVSPSVNALVRFAKLPFKLNDRTSAPRTNVTANFDLTLRDPDNSGKIRTSELSGLPRLLNATVAGTASLNMAMQTDLPTGVVMPRLSTDFTLDWNYASPQTVNPSDNNQSFGNAPQFALRNNSIHINTFFNSFARGVMNRIADVTSPFDGLIDILTTEIPLLSDLGSSAVTILDVAGASEEQVAAIAGLNGLAGLRNFSASESLWWNMGSYAWNGDPRTAPLSALTPSLISIPAARPVEMTNFLTAAGDISGLSFPLVDGAAGTAHGNRLADLLMGRPADLFRYKSGTIELSDEFHAYYPVLGPVGVTLGGRAGVKTQFGFGFDTQGIFDYFDAGPNASGDLLFNGFYAIAADENGDPFTGISLFAGVTAGVEANVGIARAGVEGDITAEIGYWLDENMGDEFGRIRADTFATLPFEELFYASGSLSAGLRAYVEVGLGPFSVGYDWESPRVTLISFDDRDNETPVLAELDPGDLTKLILNVGERADRRLHGPTDDRAEEFTITGGANGITVTAFNAENTFSSPSLIVARPNLRGDIIDLDPGLPVAARLHGGDGRDILRGGASADELHGDAGLDKLEGRGGNDFLYGGDDNDELVGGPGADTLDGGPGEDTASWWDSPTPITINLQTNERTGEAAQDTLISIERYKGSKFDDVMDGRALDDALLNGGPGNDLIRGHAGNDQLEGGSDNDTVEGGPGNDLINGGSGADLLDGGEGTDILSYLSTAPVPLPEGVVLEPVTVNLKTGLGTRGDADGDVVSGFEILYGSGVPAGVTSPFASGDDLTGSDNADTIHAMGGADLIHGGEGNDILYGDNSGATEELFLDGFDADTIYGDGGHDQIFGQNDNDKLYGGEGHDALDGGPGDDTLDGGPGNNTMLAGVGDDHLVSNNPSGIDVLEGGAGYNRLSADYSDKTTPLLFTVGPNNTYTFPDGDRFTGLQTLGVLTTGSANDVIRLAAAKEPSYFPKTINAGPGDDLVITDWRGLYSFGKTAQRSPDHLHGGDGNDTLSFEQSIGGVIVNLETGALAGPALGLTLTGFENLTGSEHIDYLTGNAGPNVFRPLRGYTGGPRPDSPNASQFVDGRAGVDTLIIDYSSLPEANQLGVFMGTLVNGAGGIMLGPKYPAGAPSAIPAAGPGLDAHTGIEIFHITGSAVDDWLITTAGGYPDRYFGLGGNDHIQSGAGDDYVDGGEGDDILEAHFGNDTVIGGPGHDTITFLANNQPDYGYGTDIVDAGPGDDFVSDAYGPIVSNATTRFLFDGGPGTDRLTADLGNLTQPVIFSELAPSDLIFSNGTSIRNFERIIDLYTGSGNDVIILTGGVNNRLVMGAGNDILNPGLGIDFVSGEGGDDLLILDFSVGDDSDLTGVIFSSGHIRRRISDNALVDQTAYNTFDRLHATGGSKADELRAFGSHSHLFGRGGNDTLWGSNGNDWIDGGPGADTMAGNGGNDTFIVDDAGDMITDDFFVGVGTDTVRASVSYTLTPNVEHLVLTGSAVNGTGNALANQITGNERNNYLRGEGGNDTLNAGGGPNEIDRLHGGANADTFVLGDGVSRFYDDGSPFSPGHGGYALIEDFTPSQTDKLRLTGSPAHYFLSPSPVPGVPGTALFHDSNASGALDALDELIAILVSPETLTVANTLTPGTFPPPVTPESIGLTAPPMVTTINDGSGGRLQLQFTISEPMTAGALLEIQASTDLGVNDPWQTIAAKNGAAAWTGTAVVTTGTPDNGRITVTLTDIPPVPGMARRFLRFRVTAP